MEEFCKEKGFLGWFETSAKENINIDEAARFLVGQVSLLLVIKQKIFLSKTNSIFVAYTLLYLHMNFKLKLWLLTNFCKCQLESVRKDFNYNILSSDVSFEFFFGGGGLKSTCIKITLNCSTSKVSWIHRYIYPISLQAGCNTESVFFKWNKAGLNSEFFLFLDLLPRLKEQSVLLFTHNWRENMDSCLLQEHKHKVKCQWSCLWFKLRFLF